MAELLITRSLDATALEPVGDGWTLHGLAVPYEHDELVSDDGTAFYLERFRRHAFEKDARRGGRWINLMIGHHGDDGERYLGRCVGIRDEHDGLYIDFRLNRDNPRAEEARSGELRGWSIGAKIFRTRNDRTGGRERRVRELAGLNHVAATPSPQYAGAGVLIARGRPRTELIRTELARTRADVTLSLARITPPRR